MLPIDEAPFKINADTREIEVPRDFAQCSGVEADNYAEIITFTVDRYFDYKDLSEASIAVQWRNANANTEGLTLIRLVDLETYGADNKIRFGWPLTKEMTAAAGNLEFAVRFFTKDENNEFNYLLNTTPKSIPIKSTLTLKPDMEPVDTDMDYFRKFVNNSQNPTYELAAPVSFYTDLEQKASIDLSTNSLDLIAQAVAQGNSPISYTWYFKPLGYYPLTMKDEKNKIIEKPSYPVYTKVEVAGEPVKYEEYTGDWPVTDEDLVGLTLYITGVSQKVLNDNDYFTIIDTDDNYSRYYPKNGDWSFRPPMSLWLKGATGSYTLLPAEGTLPEQQWPNNLSKDNDDVYEVYVKDSKLHINDSDLDIIGEYWVVAENVTGYTDDDDNFIVVNTSDNMSQVCKINPPDEIDIPEEEKLPSAKFLSTETEENKISMAFEHDYSEPHRTYEVYQHNTAGADVKKASGDVTFNNQTKMDNTLEYTVTEAGTYYFNIKTELNRYSKTKEKAGGEITFYNLPVTPSGMMYLKRNDWAQEIAVSDEAFVDPEGSYKGSYTTTDGATAEDPKTYIATFGENTDTSSNQYELIVKRTDNITTIGNSQSLKYNWTL
jgi:hypothetical protein